MRSSQHHITNHLRRFNVQLTQSDPCNSDHPPNRQYMIYIHNRFVQVHTQEFHTHTVLLRPQVAAAAPQVPAILRECERYKMYNLSLNTGTGAQTCSCTHTRPSRWPLHVPTHLLYTVSVYHQTLIDYTDWLYPYLTTVKRRVDSVKQQHWMGC